jgi:hypothetical protein
MFLDIIHRHVFFHLRKTHNGSETAFCLRFQMKPIQLGPIDRAGPKMFGTHCIRPQAWSGKSIIQNNTLLELRVTKYCYNCDPREGYVDNHCLL